MDRGTILRLLGGSAGCIKVLKSGLRRVLRVSGPASSALATKPAFVSMQPCNLQVGMLQQAVRLLFGGPSIVLRPVQPMIPRAADAGLVVPASDPCALADAIDRLCRLSHQSVSVLALTAMPISRHIAYPLLAQRLAQLLDSLIVW